MIGGIKAGGRVKGVLLGRFPKEMILYQFAQDVAERDVTFLNASCDRRRNDERVIDQRGQLSAIGACPGDRSQATVAGRRDTFQHVRRISAGADANRNVPFSACARTWRAKSSSYP